MYSKSYLVQTYLRMIQRQACDRIKEFPGVKGTALSYCWSDIHSYRKICDPRFLPLTDVLYGEDKT